jgi:hypothetical protein
LRGQNKQCTTISHPKSKDDFARLCDDVVWAEMPNQRTNAPAFGPNPKIAATKRVSNPPQRRLRLERVAGTDLPPDLPDLPHLLAPRFPLIHPVATSSKTAKTHFNLYLCRFPRVYGAKSWSQLSDLNRRPTVYKTVALPLS